MARWRLERVKLPPQRPDPLALRAAFHALARSLGEPQKFVPLLRDQALRQIGEERVKRGGTLS